MEDHIVVDGLSQVGFRTAQLRRLSFLSSLAVVSQALRVVFYTFLNLLFGIHIEDLYKVQFTRSLHFRVTLYRLLLSFEVQPFLMRVLR